MYPKSSLLGVGVRRVSFASNRRGDKGRVGPFVDIFNNNIASLGDEVTDGRGSKNVPCVQIK